ncbi:GTP-binding protein [Tenacibaculum salmonis]|uniref:GTP-binding protein n=1 Tax=Tenacibaculum sp. P3-BQ1 TaxID=3232310 RepID=UPI0034DE701F
MEAIITIVGFLGAGKTTLLKHLVLSYLEKNFNPFVILNDYENANLDASQLAGNIEQLNIKALTGSCICCSGIDELRNYVNNTPERVNGVTLIEANGTSDACTLMEFLGVGLNKRFLPPIQISVVDVKNWQNRGVYNDLELNQIQVSSLIVLTHLEKTTKKRQELVVKELKKNNPYATILTINEIDISLFNESISSKKDYKKLAHKKAHWSSCSIDLLKVPSLKNIYYICENLPSTIQRVKGCVEVENEKGYTYFERTPNGEVFVRPFRGIPITGPKLLTIGPGSDISLLKKVVKESFFI